MSIFSGGSLPQHQAPQQQQQAQMHTQQQGTAPNMNGASAQGGGQPTPQWQDPTQRIVETATNGQQMQQGGNGQQINDSAKNELDAYSKWFTMPQGGEGQQAPEALDAPLFTMDAGKLAEAMKQASFTGSIDPQLMQRALTGDQAAMSDMLNGVARNVMQQAVIMMQNMVQGGIGTYNGRLAQHLPNQFKQFAAKEQIGGKPNMQHGAVQPVVAAFVQQAMQADPTLTVAQATQQVENYMKLIAKQFATNQSEQQQPVDALTGAAQQQQQAPTNWMALLGR